MTPAEVFSCKYCKIFKKSFSYRTAPVAASANIPNVETEHQNKLLALKLKPIALVQSCKHLKGFMYSFKMGKCKNEFYDSNSSQVNKIIHFLSF